MAPRPTLVARDSSDDGMTGIYIAGFCVAGAVVLMLAIWFGVKMYRKRAKKANGTSSTTGVADVHIEIEKVSTE